MLTDAQWAMLEPLIEACRPKGKTPPRDLRRTMTAILCSGSRRCCPAQELCPPRPTLAGVSRSGFASSSRGRPARESYGQATD